MWKRYSVTMNRLWAWGRKEAPCGFSGWRRRRHNKNRKNCYYQSIISLKKVFSGLAYSGERLLDIWEHNITKDLADIKRFHRPAGWMGLLTVTNGAGGRHSASLGSLIGISLHFITLITDCSGLVLLLVYAELILM